MRYLGVYFTHWTMQKFFYPTANAIFRKVGQVAPEEVTLRLITLKCIPVLLYCLEACPLLKSQVAPLDFVVNRFL